MLTVMQNLRPGKDKYLSIIINMITKILNCLTISSRLLLYQYLMDISFSVGVQTVEERLFCCLVFMWKEWLNILGSVLILFLAKESWMRILMFVSSLLSYSQQLLLNEFISEQILFWLRQTKLAGCSFRE